MLKYYFEKFKLDKSSLETLVNLNLKFSREEFKINENPNRVKHDLESNFNKGIYDCYVAKKDKNMVGYLLWSYGTVYHKTFKNAFIIEYYVLPNHRENIIESNLVSLTLNYLKAKNYKQCFINVDYDNKEMLKLIKSFKFEPAYKKRNLFKKKL